MSASQLSAAIRTRKVSCVETMQAYLDRIDRFNPVYNAIVSRPDPATLVAQARQADDELANGRYRGWMHGMPHAVKDLANASGLPTSHGSPLFAGTLPVEDDIHVARLRKAGAIFIGKTNVPEFGTGSQSYNTVFGVTRNAYDVALTSGGSSGGAAVGMATHMLPAADGSDMMGSLRNPAAFNNVIGFRPSFGRVPNTGDEIFYSQLATNGPMGRNVEDTIRLLVTMSGFDARSPQSMRDALPEYDAFTAMVPNDVRIGWLGDFDGYLATEPGVIALCEHALRGLEVAGVRIEPVRPAFDVSRLWQCWLNLRHWSQAGRLPLLDNPASRAQLKPEMIFEIEGSRNLAAAHIHAAALTRTQWYHALHAMLESYDFLALPSAQVFPFAAEVHWPDTIADRSMDTYHRWMEVVIGASLAGVPTLSLPAGFDTHGRPMGIQLIGRYGCDQQVLEFGMTYERLTGHLARRPQLVAATGAA
ncbi:MAG: amidase [Gammaproteobacteria bacterium]|nr:amidase [Gammaproteobacteria bacterium]